MSIFRFFLIPLLIGLINIRFSSGQTAKIDSLEQILKTLDEDTTKVILMNQLAREHLHTNTERAVKLLNSAKEISIRLNFVRGLSKTFEGLGQISTYLRDLYRLPEKNDEAIHYYFESLKAKLALNDSIGAATTYQSLGWLFSNKGEIDSALKYTEFSITIYALLGDSLSVERGQSNIRMIMTLYSTKMLEKRKDKEIGILNQDKNFQKLELQKKEVEVEKQKLAQEKIKIEIQLLSKTKKIQELELNKNKNEIESERFTSAALKKEKQLQDTVISKQQTVRNILISGGLLTIAFLSLAFFGFYRNKREKFNTTVEHVSNKSLRSQMNPHFIFNSLNSIDDYIHNNDIKNSSLYINKFSRLMRMILESSRMDEVSIKEDLEAIELYIQLENLRMRNKVVYMIDVSPEINQEQLLIPPMLLQPFLENAFKHAYEGIEKPTLEVKIFLKNEMLHYSVIDNGSGRFTKAETELDGKIKNESLGLRVTQERLDIINKIQKTKAFLAFEDPTNSENKPAGTKVELAIPVSYAF